MRWQHGRLARTARPDGCMTDTLELEMDRGARQRTAQDFSESARFHLDVKPEALENADALTVVLDSVASSHGAWSLGARIRSDAT